MFGFGYLFVCRCGYDTRIKIKQTKQKTPHHHYRFTRRLRTVHDVRGNLACGSATFKFIPTEGVKANQLEENFIGWPNGSRCRHHRHTHTKLIHALAGNWIDPRQLIVGRWVMWVFSPVPPCNRQHIVLRRGLLASNPELVRPCLCGRWCWVVTSLFTGRCSDIANISYVLCIPRYGARVDNNIIPLSPGPGYFYDVCAWFLLRYVTQKGNVLRPVFLSSSLFFLLFACACVWMPDFAFFWCLLR